MSHRSIDIIADPEIIKQALALAEERGIQASAPMQTESVSDALNSPFGVEELRQVCEVITLVVSTGTSVAGFLAALKALMPQTETVSGKPPVADVRDTLSREQIVELRPDTDLGQLDD